MESNWASSAAETDEVERLLAAARISPIKGSEIDTSRLLALRAGRLDAEARQRLEEQLCRDPEGRRLLVALGEGPIEQAVARAEAAFPKRKFRWPLLIVAGALLVGATVGWLVLDQAAPTTTYSLDPLLGLQPNRAPSAPATFLPDTPLSLRLRPSRGTEERPEIGVSVVLDGDQRAVALEGDYANTGEWSWTGPARAVFGDRGGSGQLEIEVAGETLTAPVTYQVTQ